MATSIADRRLMVRSWLSGRRAWFALSAVMVIAGLALGWNWLVAVGIAPILLGLAPCVAMCALGLCASRLLGKSSCDKSLKSTDTVDMASNSGGKAPRIDDAPSLRLKP